MPGGPLVIFPYVRHAGNPAAVLSRRDGVRASTEASVYEPTDSPGIVVLSFVKFDGEIAALGVYQTINVSYQLW